MAYAVGLPLVSAYLKQRRIRSVLDAAVNRLPSGRELRTSSDYAARVNERLLRKNFGLPPNFDLTI